MLQALELARGFHQHQMAFDVGLGIGVGVDQRIAHAGLGRQMDDPGDVGMAGEGLFHGLALGNVGAHHGKALMGQQARGALFLQRDVVIVVEVVDADHLLAPRQKRLRGVKADKAGGTGNQNTHEPKDPRG